MKGERIDYTAVREYLEVVSPRRLISTFGMPQFSPDFDRTTVEIVSDSDGCILTLTQENIRTVYQKSIKRSWSTIMDALTSALA